MLREEQTATTEEVGSYCREELAAYKVPRLIEFRGSLPNSGARCDALSPAIC